MLSPRSEMLKYINERDRGGQCTCSAHLGTQVIVENLQRSQLLIHPLGVVSLLLLDNVSSCFDYSLHFKLDFTQNFIEFLKNKDDKFYLLVITCLLEPFQNMAYKD